MVDRLIQAPLIACLAAGTVWAAGDPFAITWPAQVEVSGIVSYQYEPNPSEIKPKMYNWEITLSPADSQSGPYEIVEVTRPLQAVGNTADVVRQVLVESKVIAPSHDGHIHFHLYIGDKTPRQNMGRQGDSAQPIIYSGVGNGTAASSWIIFPGAKFDRVVPSPTDTRLTDGRLSLIRFIVSNARGMQFQTDVLLTRK